MLRAASRLRVASRGSMPRSSGRRMTPRSRRFSTMRRSRAEADRRVAGHAADRLLALLVAAAQQQVGDAFLGEDVRHVVAVDHDRRQLHAGLLRPASRHRAARRTRAACARGRSRPSAPRASGRAACPRRRCGPARASRPAFSQAGLAWRRPRASAPMLGAPPKPAMRPSVAVELLPCRSICSVEPMNMSQA